MASEWRVLVGGLLDAMAVVGHSAMVGMAFKATGTVDLASVLRTVRYLPAAGQTQQAGRCVAV